MDSKVLYDMIGRKDKAGYYNVSLIQLGSMITHYRPPSANKIHSNLAHST